MENVLVSIGKIVSIHGLRGEVKVFPHTDFPERIYDLKRIRLKERDRIVLMDIDYVRYHGRYWLIKLNPVNNREEAAALKGQDIYISEHERFELPPHCYYHDDLTGLDVYTTEGYFLGVISEIMPGGGRDVFAVQLKDREKPLLIPAAKEIVKSVDLQIKRITVSLPEGLLEL